MTRQIVNLIDNWSFALEKDGKPNADQFESVFIPHDWALKAPVNKNMDYGSDQGFRERWGIGWYRYSFQQSEIYPNFAYYLDFGGVYENCTVWLNGQLAGTQEYGYSPFRLPITKLLRLGENTIEVKVDNTQKPVDRWYSGAGIYRPVKLLAMHQDHMDEKAITVKTTLQGKNAKIAIKTGVKADIEVILTWQGKQVGYDRQNQDHFILTLPEAKLWTAETPNLYQLTLRLYKAGELIDSYTQAIGIRTVEVNAKGLTINGQPVKLKGVNVHQDVGCRGIAAKKEIWLERLLALKEMGCNTIRAAHHLYAEEFLDLCDTLGFYVYEEPFDKWQSGLYQRYFEENWQQDINAMVKRDRNRPSIIIWGVGNEVENQGEPSMINNLKKLTDYVRLLDPSRPVTYAMIPIFKQSKSDIKAQATETPLLTNEFAKKIVNEGNNEGNNEGKGEVKREVTNDIDDSGINDINEKVACIARIAEHVDIISGNYMEQWYEYIHESVPDKPILGTEIYQYFRGHPLQLQNYAEEVPALEPLKADYIIGGLIWTGIDYLGESMGYPSKGWSGAPITTNNRRRAAFYLLQSYWQEKPMVHFSTMDYSQQDELVKEHWDIPMYVEHWDFPQFRNTVIPYMIVSNCEKVELYHNDKRYYTAQPADFKNRVMTGFLPWQPGQVKVIGYRQGQAVCSHTLQTPGPAAKLKFEKAELAVPADAGYEVLLTVKATDLDDAICVRESALVHFSVEGDAEIIGVDNGNLCSHEPYDEQAIHLYRGCASVQIRFNRATERVKISAYASGLHHGSAVLYHSR